MDREKELRRIFLREKPVLIAKELMKGRTTITKISKRTDITNANISRVIKRREELGVIVRKRKGRKNYIYLTEYGKNKLKFVDEHD